MTILEEAKKKATARGHIMSHKVRAIDEVYSCCINCGEEIAVILDEYGRESFVDYNDCEYECGFPEG